MLIPRIILFQSDPFWGNANLDVLRMLVSTCKGFRAELLGGEKRATRMLVSTCKGFRVELLGGEKGATLFDNALLTLTIVSLNSA